MDSDDIMTPDKLLLLRSALNKRQQLAVGLVKYISDGTLGEGYKKYADWLNGMTMNRSNFSEIYKECVIPSPCWMMHREDLNAVGAFDSDIYPEDYDLAFRMRHNGITIQDVPEVIHLWRDHPSRASRNDPHYMDNQFIQIKVQHFLNSDYNAAQSLVVWGAGKKGKKIVKLLRGHHIDVHWICNNPKKIGTTIYDTRLHHPDSLMSIVSAQVIIAIAQKNAERDIRSHLQNHDGMDVYYFC
jgi:GT2 family glycosyltransferase